MMSTHRPTKHVNLNKYIIYITTKESKALALCMLHQNIISPHQFYHRSCISKLERHITNGYSELVSQGVIHILSCCQFSFFVINVAVFCS